MTPQDRDEPRVYRRRLLVNRFNLADVAGDDGASAWRSCCGSCACCSGNGFAALSPTLFTQTTPPPGSAGGLANAIFGSVRDRRWSPRSSARRSASSPASISPSSASGGWLARATRFINDILLSAPSIVIGLFVYTVYVAQVEHFSGWAGSVALALIAIPVVVRTTENMLQLVPSSLREAAVALGAPMWKVILMVTLQGGARRRDHRHPARGGADVRRDGAAAVHRAQQPVLEQRT